MSDSDETYNGWANRETWAFNLHWQNEEGLYRTVLEWVSDFFDGPRDYENSDMRLGEYIVEQSQELWREAEQQAEPSRFYGRSESPLRMWERETGSVWRLDLAEVGAAARESFGAETEVES